MFYYFFPLDVIVCKVPPFTTILPPFQGMKITPKSEKRIRETARSKITLRSGKSWEIEVRKAPSSTKLLQAPAVGAGDAVFILRTPPTLQAVLAGRRHKV